MNQNNMVMMRLSGHQVLFPLAESAHPELRSYLSNYRDSLTGDADRDEIIRDIEASIGDHLAETSADVTIGEHKLATLNRVGPVVSGAPGAPVPKAQCSHRPFRRLQEGKWLTGVVKGIATARGLSAYWVRGIFVAISLLTGSLLAPLGEGYPMLLVFGLSIVTNLVATVALKPIDTHKEYILT